MSQGGIAAFRASGGLLPATVHRLFMGLLPHGGRISSGIPEGSRRGDPGPGGW